MLTFNEVSTPIFTNKNLSGRQDMSVMFGLSNDG